MTECPVVTIVYQCLFCVHTEAISFLFPFQPLLPTSMYSFPSAFLSQRERERESSTGTHTYTEGNRDTYIYTHTSIHSLGSTCKREHAILAFHFSFILSSSSPHIVAISAGKPLIENQAQLAISLNDWLTDR